MPKATPNHRILIVDDISSIHLDFKKILNPTNSSNDYLNKMNESMNLSFSKKPKLPPFQIDSAFQSLDAVYKVKKSVLDGNPYALAFVDVQMPPGEDGVDTIAHLWSIDPNIQIVICTAYAKYSWEDLINRFGETDSLFILKKPFDTIEVIQLACSLTKKWNLKNQILSNLPDTSKPANEPANRKNGEGNEKMTSLAESISELKSLNERLKSQSLLNQIQNPPEHEL